MQAPWRRVEFSYNDGYSTLSLRQSGIPYGALGTRTQRTGGSLILIRSPTSFSSAKTESRASLLTDTWAEVGSTGRQRSYRRK